MYNTLYYTNYSFIICMFRIEYFKGSPTLKSSECVSVHKGNNILNNCTYTIVS